MKLISTAADDTKNKNVCLRGGVSQFQDECLLGLYRIQCANHHFDLAIKAIVTAVMKESFQVPFLAIISYLRRQTTLCSEMGTTCPDISLKD